MIVDRCAKCLSVGQLATTTPKICMHCASKIGVTPSPKMLVDESEDLKVRVNQAIQYLETLKRPFTKDEIYTTAYTSQASVDRYSDVKRIVNRAAKNSINTAILEGLRNIEPPFTLLSFSKKIGVSHQVIITSPLHKQVLAIGAIGRGSSDRQRRLTARLRRIWEAVEMMKDSSYTGAISPNALAKLAHTQKSCVEACPEAMRALEEIRSLKEQHRQDIELLKAYKEVA